MKLEIGDRVSIDKIENGYWKGVVGVGTFEGYTPTGKCRVRRNGKLKVYAGQNLTKVNKNRA